MPHATLKSGGVEITAESLPTSAWSALGTLPLILSAACGSKRMGACVLGATLCARRPAMVAVSIRSGQWIDPLIRDSHHFAICSLESGERVLSRRLTEAASRYADPFDGLSVRPFPQTRCPVPASSALALECEVVRHIDMEADHELYVGRVLSWRWTAHAVMQAC